MTRQELVQDDMATESDKLAELPVFSVDLREAARRSESEVSEWVPERLDQAIQRYRKFFHLASLDPGVAPTREIDMIWHLHMQAPVAYYNDCIRH
ncbi:MAG: glycine-rich domain-containing protein-like, partial [Rhodospirillaceae bacterium]|nr:glycine-rich domain-containing protein-like [Rhodospirillaceae bacterium]